MLLLNSNRKAPTIVFHITYLVESTKENLGNTLSTNIISNILTLFKILKLKSVLKLNVIIGKPFT